ncbi:MAG: ABC transporter permease [Deltaproteobacteria bacterium]|nr:ABC transporter permease [Deltaproteobacteria bacterium]
MDTQLKSSKPIPLTALVFIGWLFLMTFIPFLIILGMSFLERTPLGTISFHFSFNNYLRSFQYIYIKVLLKTVWLALVATLSCLAIGFPVAYYLARSGGWLKQLGLVLLFIPFWTNFILRVYGLVSLLGNHGLINQLLLEWELIKTPLEILYTRTGVYLGLLYNYLPFLVVPIFSSLEKLDPSLREAGFDLGANRIQVFWKVVVPNIKEGVFVGSLFVFIPMLGEYVIPDLLGGAKEAFLGNVMVSQFFVMQDWPFGSAIAGMLSLLLLITLWIQTRWSRIGGFRNGIDNAKS